MLILKGTKTSINYEIEVSFWNISLSLKYFVDDIIYRVFLGVAKATQNLINTWIKVTKRISKFNLVRKRIFGPISVMGLKWCKIFDTESG